MTDYNELVDSFVTAIDEADGTVPDTGVALVLSADAYAAYAYLNGYTVDDLSEFYDEAEDAYQGEYDSDEDFAQEQANSFGMLDNEYSAGWPYNHIDWKAAARELMMDYSEHDRFYFRD